MRNSNPEMNKRPDQPTLAPRPSKIPIAISRRVRSDVTQDIKTRPAASQPIATSHLRSVNKVDTFKRNRDKYGPHRQLDVSSRPMSTKSRPDIVPSRKSVTEDIPSIKSASEVIRSRTKIVQSTNEAILSRKSTMIKSILKDETFDKGANMVRFQEICDQLKKIGHHRRPLLLVNKPTTNNSITSDQEDDFRRLVEKAAYSQRRRNVCQTPASPGYTKVMQEASETMLRSVNHLYGCRKRATVSTGYHHHQLNAVRTNLTNQLDCCCKMADTSATLPCDNNRRRTIILQQAAPQGRRNSFVDGDSASNSLIVR
ncbi:uncharacterized protein [Dysidea avara]|uniref:uncharacterized protein n=1 Tax=Dysidea avara TaxID=196820 RepID=UPI00332DD63A